MEKDELIFERPNSTMPELTNLSLAIGRETKWPSAQDHRYERDQKNGGIIFLR